MRKALLSDIPTLIKLMLKFYAESGFDLNQAKAENAFSAIISNEKLGFVFLIDSNGMDVGYIVLTFRFSMEHGGLIACLDDFFIVPQNRNKGIGGDSLIQVVEFCKNASIRAITVEVGRNNNLAKKVYRHIGMYEAPDRQLFILPLEKPTHFV